MSTVATRVEPPPALYTALEVRAVAERTAMTAAMPLLRRLPRGDGHPVFVLPGFVASDRSTAPLRRLLRELGYAASGWQLGPNLGPTPEILHGMLTRFDRIHQRYGRPVSIVGWSLGGIYAREIARQFPGAVRQVVSLGSPVQMTAGDRSAASGTWESLRHRYDPAIDEGRIPESQKPPLDVPATSIYTRTDGVVHWTTCLIERTPISENVEVFGSHCGLGYNPWAVFVVADRLAQPPGDWTRFSAPLVLRGGFPRSTDWRPPRTGPPTGARSS